MPGEKFTVMMHADLVDQLDERLSPIDGLAAIDQMFLELPKLHPAPAPKRSACRTSKRLKAYRGRYEWSGLNFTYVQIGAALHVLDLWNDGEVSSRQPVDVVLGSGPVEEYAPVEAMR